MHAMYIEDYIQPILFDQWIRTVNSIPYRPGYPLYLFLKVFAREQRGEPIELILPYISSNREYPADSGHVPWLDAPAAEIAEYPSADWEDPYIALINILAWYCKFFFSEDQKFAPKTMTGLTSEFENASGVCASLLCVEATIMMVNSMPKPAESYQIVSNQIVAGLLASRACVAALCLPSETDRDIYYNAHRSIDKARNMQRFGKMRTRILESAQVSLWMVRDGYQPENGMGIANDFDDSPIPISAEVVDLLKSSIEMLFASENFMCRVMPRIC